MATPKKKSPAVSAAPSKAQEKAMGELMALVKGGFKREDETKTKDAAGTAQPPATRPSSEQGRGVVPEPVAVQVPQEPSMPQVPHVLQVPLNPQVSSVLEGVQEPREFRNPSALGIQRPLGLDVPLQRRAFQTPPAKEKAMSASGSGWTKIGWYIQESTKAAADVEIRRLQTTGSDFLDLAIRHYIAGLQTAGQDPEILLDDAAYLIQDLIKQGMTNEIRERAQEFLQQLG